MSLAVVDATSEVAVTDYLTRARDWLSRAVDETGPEQIAAAKAEIATAAEATKQLGLSKEIQLDAQEMVRRAEYALGKAIRKGQAQGTIRGPEGGRLSSGTADTTSKVGDFLPHEGSIRKEIYTITDNLDPESLDEVLAEAKAEGNLSRANVARKARGAQDEPKDADRTADAEVFNALMAYIRKAITPDRTSGLKPRGRAALINTLQHAIDVLTQNGEPA